MSSVEQLLRRNGMKLTPMILLERFIATGETEGKSPATGKWYRKRIGKYMEFLGENSGIEGLNINTARAFVAHLQAQEVRYKDHPFSPEVEGGLSPHTIHGYVRAMKAFGSWLTAEGYASENPFTRLKRPRLPKTLIEVLTADEIRGMVSSLNDKTDRGCRLKVIVVLLLDTGMRANELLGITLDDIDWDQQTIKVLGKGSKERIVGFSTNTKLVMLRYLLEHRPQSDDQHFVLAEGGTPLSYDALAHIIKRLGVSCDTPRLHAHLFRHTYAVRYLMNGGDLMTLRDILGHTSIDVTQKYLHLSKAHIRASAQRFSPVANLGLR